MEARRERETEGRKCRKKIIIKGRRGHECMK